MTSSLPQLPPPAAGAFRALAQQREGEVSLRYENSVCKYILKQSSLANKAKLLERESRAEWGDPYMRLEQIWDHGLTWLRFDAAKPDKGLHTLDLGDLFKRPTKTPIFELIQQHYGKTTGSGKSVLVFPWRGVSSYFCAHEDVAEAVVGLNMRMTVRNRTFTMEPLDALLDRELRDDPSDWWRD